MDYLQVDTPAEVAAERRQTSLATPMAGVRQGGLAGVTDEALGSEFGQVILQTLLRLRATGLVAVLPLIRAALSAELPMLREVAIETLRGWPGDVLAKHPAFAALLGVRSP